MRFYRQNQKQAYLFRNSPLNMDRVHILYVYLLFFRVLFCFAFHVEWKKIMWSVLETCDSELPPLASRVSVFLCIQWELICGCWWCDARCIPIFLISEEIDNRNCLNFTMVTLNCQYIGWKIAVHFRKKNITKKVEYTKKKKKSRISVANLAMNKFFIVQLQSTFGGYFTCGLHLKHRLCMKIPFNSVRPDNFNPRRIA